MPWLASKIQNGYGHFSIKKKHVLSHRFMKELALGKILEKDGSWHGICVCHSCDNRNCVNPFHLFTGSNKDNMNDRNNKNRQARLKGKANGNAKFSEQDKEQINKIFYLRSTGLTQQQIANIIGYSREHIRDILNGKKRTL